ncbi:hypothetical protein [Massilia sp. CCM 8734]|uniref:hypothetical protein n=1 Tax=Massilia sp. CCM 8734 TaxID=2609283 RepID=UPI0016AE3A88|nr:hypothetical protein [Massilia sp. CCM 8734]NHZ97470.1 hypothetical protein [Massilia sp. CCM 8734]
MMTSTFEENIERLLMRLINQPAPLPVQIDAWDIEHIARPTRSVGRWSYNRTFQRRPCVAF